MFAFLISASFFGCEESPKDRESRQNPVEIGGPEAPLRQSKESLIFNGTDWKPLWFWFPTALDAEPVDPELTVLGLYGRAAAGLYGSVDAIDDSDSYCTGSLITETLFLTAAHCVDDCDPEEDDCAGHRNPGGAIDSRVFFQSEILVAFGRYDREPGELDRRALEVRWLEMGFPFERFWRDFELQRSLSEFRCKYEEGPEVAGDSDGLRDAILYNCEDVTIDLEERQVRLSPGDIWGRFRASRSLDTGVKLARLGSNTMSEDADRAGTSQDELRLAIGGQVEDLSVPCAEERYGGCFSDRVDSQGGDSGGPVMRRTSAQIVGVTSGHRWCNADRDVAEDAMELRWHSFRSRDCRYNMAARLGERTVERSLPDDDDRLELPFKRAGQDAVVNATGRTAGGAIDDARATKLQCGNDQYVAGVMFSNRIVSGEIRTSFADMALVCRSDVRDVWNEWPSGLDEVVAGDPVDLVRDPRTTAYHDYRNRAITRSQRGRLQLTESLCPPEHSVSALGFRLHEGELGSLAEQRCVGTVWDWIAPRALYTEVSRLVPYSFDYRDAVAYIGCEEDQVMTGVLFDSRADGSLDSIDAICTQLAQ